MKKQILTWAVLTSFVIVTLIGCGGSSALVGKWVLEEDNFTEFSAVPSFEFFRDGTGMAIQNSGGGLGITWSLDGNRFRMTYASGRSFTFNVRITSSTLTFIADNDGGSAIFKKQK